MHNSVVLVAKKEKVDCSFEALPKNYEYIQELERLENGFLSFKDTRHHNNTKLQVNKKIFTINLTRDNKNQKEQRKLNLKNKTKAPFVSE